MKAMNHLQFTKRANFAHIVVRAATWAFMFLTGAGVLALVALLVLPEATFNFSSSDLVRLRLELSPGLLIDANTLLNHQMVNMKAVIFPIVGGICIASAWLVLIFKELQSLLTHVIAANPFAPENGKSLGRIAIYLAVFAFIKPAFVVYIYSQMIRTFSLGGFHTTYKVDILLVFISLMLALLGQVFKYGSYLQTEFDETL